MDLAAVRGAITQGSHKGHADLKQDILALAIHGFKRDGYFVEFGALDGVTGSNTYILETQYAWQGIVAEAASVWHQKLRENRCCVTDTRAVAAHSGLNLTFKETDVQLGLSGLVDYFDHREYHAARRSHSTGNSYKVATISLNDLLAEHQAPTNIDYISMDTEGSEPAILSTFDFSRHRVALWTIEHNYFDAARQTILDIMTRNGYERILPDLSTIDDWYVLA
jgi:FkbM family methyltransferase